MVLSDRSIKEELAKGRIVISPLNPDDIQPASVDLHLDGRVLVFANSRRPYIDVKEGLEDLTQMVEIQDESPFILHPGEFVLGSTLENIELPDALVARLEGKSSLGRIGLVIHSTAGFVDPGWKGHLTLELSNLARLPITLYKGMKIGQISYLKLTTPADRLYGSESLGSKYQGTNGSHGQPVQPGFRKSRRSTGVLNRFMSHMQQAVELAYQVIGSTSPNPAVGALLVKDGVEIGRGATQPPGQDHAEIVALKQASDQARGATLYTTLEPCCTLSLIHI